MQVRSIDYDVARGVALVGSNQCDVLEVTPAAQEVLVYGHCDNVWCVAAHPLIPQVAASACEKVRACVRVPLAANMQKAPAKGKSGQARPGQLAIAG